MKKLRNLTTILAVSILTTVVLGENRLGAGLLCTRLVDRITVSVESKRMLFHETVVALTHQDPGSVAKKHSYGHFFILPIYRVKGDGSAEVIGGGLPKISISSGTVSGLRYVSETGISRINGRWTGTDGVYIFDVLFGDEVPDRITFTVEMTAVIEEFGAGPQFLCSLSSDGRVEAEGDRECSLRVIGPNGEIGAVVDGQTAIKADKNGWCVVGPDKYYSLNCFQ